MLTSALVNSRSTSTVILCSSHEQKIKSKEAKRKEEKRRGADRAHAELPTRYGSFTIYGFRGRGREEEPVALVRGNLKAKTAPWCASTSMPDGRRSRLAACDGRAQLELSMKKIGLAGSGVLLYLPQEAAHGLMNKLRPTNCRTAAWTR